MVSSPLSLAVIALASAAVVSDAKPEENQIFTSYYPVATTTIHVGAPSTTTSSAATTATATGGVPADCLHYGVEFAAIQRANYRKVGISHADAVKIARDGVNLYVQQPAIADFINSAYSYVSNNWDTIFPGNKSINLPANATLQAVHAFHEANEKVLASPGFADLDNYLKTNLNKFDIGAGLSDIQHLVEIDPALAHKGFGKARDFINSSPSNQQAFEEAKSMVFELAEKYNIRRDLVQSGINNMLNTILF